MTRPDAHLTEYTALKAEQLGRINARDNYMYSTLAVIIAAIAAAAQAGLPHLLLAVPPACAVLGWTRLRNDAHIIAIRCYLRDQLAPKVGAQVFGWETGPRSRLTRWVQFTADMVTFVVPGILAVTAWGALAPKSAWGLMAAFVDAVITGLLAALIVHHARTQRGSDKSTPATETGS